MFISHLQLVAYALYLLNVRPEVQTIARYLNGHAQV